MTDHILACPKCGSRNTALKNSMPTGNSLKDLLSGLLDICKPKLSFPNSGQKFVVCKNCGYKAVVMVN